MAISSTKAEDVSSQAVSPLLATSVRPACAKAVPGRTASRAANGSKRCLIMDVPPQARSTTGAVFLQNGPSAQETMPIQASALRLAPLPPKHGEYADGSGKVGTDLIRWHVSFEDGSAAWRARGCTD